MCHVSVPPTLVNPKTTPLVDPQKRGTSTASKRELAPLAYPTPRSFTYTPLSYRRRAQLLPCCRFFSTQSDQAPHVCIPDETAWEKLSPGVPRQPGQPLSVCVTRFTRARYPRLNGLSVGPRGGLPALPKQRRRPRGGVPALQLEKRPKNGRVARHLYCWPDGTGRVTRPTASLKRVKWAGCPCARSREGC